MNYNYMQLLLDKNKFKQAAGVLSKDFNILDLPSLQYFKIFFHFNNGDSNFGNSHSGLLALPDPDIPLIDPTNEELISDSNVTKSNTEHFDPDVTLTQTPEKKLEKLSTSINYDNYKDRLREQSSAWSYLIENGEDERARLLLIFINLLLNITANAPWYFQKISGLDLALERKATSEGVKIEELRQKITLTCLPDAIDHRIGTLLDLYRSIVFSWQLKKEIVPANLRKFDMSIYIFEAPITEQLKFEKTLFGTFDKNDPKISYKYIELHNCEIDYGSSKSIYAELNDIEGINPEYNIDIFFDDIYETRYNQWAAVSAGDMLKSDYSNKIYTPGAIEAKNEKELKSINDKILNVLAMPKKGKSEELLKRKKLFDPQKFLKGAKDQLIGFGKSVISRLIKRVYLGNLFTFSLSNAKDGFKSFASGNILNTVHNVGNVVRKFDDNASRTGVSGNLFDLKSEEIDMGELKSLGNLFKAKSVQNNI